MAPHKNDITNRSKLDATEMLADILEKLEQIRETKPKTYVINLKSPTRVGGRYEVANVRGIGQMREFMVMSDSPDFTVHVKADGGTLYEDTWTELNAISQSVGEVAAYEENGKYVAHLEDIDFNDELIVRLYGVFTAERVFLKYDLYLPRGRRFIPQGEVLKE